MRKLFKAIRNKDLNEVKLIIDKNPNLVNCTSKQPPKKDDGQSPLQVALKVGAFDIAEFLIENGADLNFIEDECCCNEWRTPVIHDAINAAVMSCRWNTNDKLYGLRVFSTKEQAQRALNILEKMLKKGADVNGLDSYGNSGIWRFCIEAMLILPDYNYSEKFEHNDRIFTVELEHDLQNVLDMLCKYGVNLNYIKPNSNKSIYESFPSKSMQKLLSNINKKEN